jgi:hypothetical protein
MEIVKGVVMTVSAVLDLPPHHAGVYGLLKGCTRTALAINFHFNDFVIKERPHVHLERSK